MNVQLVVFTLDQEEYAVAITDIREVVRVPEITPLPNTPEFISGVINLRGKIVVVIDLEKRFALVREHPAAPKHCLVTEEGGTSFGVLTDEVIEIVRVAEEEIQPTPALVSVKIHADYLKGVVILKPDRLLVLLDLPKLLQEKELLAVQKAAKKIEESSK